METSQIGNSDPGVLAETGSQQDGNMAESALARIASIIRHRGWNGWRKAQ
jgi:hypothetical protein